MTKLGFAHFVRTSLIASGKCRPNKKKVSVMCNNKSDRTVGVEAGELPAEALQP
jgi:hypothetical protein